ncbi:methyltransferase domain-containing protein, partial [Roseomonas sp. DSM 102946]|nr:methyltransferase domain-containing protein [Roseomonas sp. DSM 102946]
LGVDIAEDSIAAAQALKGLAPLDFAVAADLSPWRGSFDIAFSYEVVYLLPDLAAHAAGIHAALRPGGVYYAVTGCHTAMPLWPAWRELIGGITHAPVQD